MRTHCRNQAGYFLNDTGARHTNRVPQGSVQIELIFRLLLKITVDWPYNAINKFLEPERAHIKDKTTITKINT